MITVLGRVSSPAPLVAAAWSIRLKITHPPAAFDLMAASNRSMVS
jgi:hypothetical protein